MIYYTCESKENVRMNFMKFIEEYYGFYKDLCETGSQTIYTKDLNHDSISQHFKNIINILKDGIETSEVQHMMIHVVFVDGEEVDLYIFDYLFNLIFWHLTTGVNAPITSNEFFFIEDITKGNIKEYIDNVFISKYYKSLDFITLNNIIDDAIGLFRELRPFQLWLANTVCLEDTIDLMKKYPEFADTVSFDISGIPIEDVKEAGMTATNIQIDYIKNSDHCLRDSFRTGEGINPKQYKEVAVNIGTKPDGRGTIFPYPIPTSFINGGLNTIESLFEESSVGRIAQMLQKQNVGRSGDFARKLGLNNQDAKLHIDPNYICDTKNFIPITIKNKILLRIYNMRYYRTNPKGVDKQINWRKDTDLIGQTIWIRSPMTCASAARGEGICYRCYGDLAYVNRDINIGQIASELLSSIYTQTLLSAKHLLESAVIKMTWCDAFFQFFTPYFNMIQFTDEIMKDPKRVHGYKMIFDPNGINNDDEYDDMVYSDYISSFTIVSPSGEEFDIRTIEGDDIYISPDLMALINKSYKEGDDMIEIDMSKVVSLDSLFSVEIKNNELSSTMQRVKNLINNKSVIKNYDIVHLLEEFLDTNIRGRIILNAVHFEVLLMNQIRSAADIIELPDWTKTDESYYIATLDESLANHPSVTIRLQNNGHLGIVKNLISPRLKDLTRPSTMDVYFMEQPQEFLYHKEHISDEFKPNSDVESAVTKGIYFVDKDGNCIEE